MDAIVGECPPTEVLEQIAAGTPVSDGARAHASTCEHCRGRVRDIREDNQFLRSFALGGSLPRPTLSFSEQDDFSVPGYRIEHEVRRGGQGVVYLATQQATRRTVAIKVMRHGPFATLADRSRFEREIAILGRLNHPNIIAIHDAGTAKGCHYFVMNYVDGSALDEAVRLPARRTRDELRRALTIFAKVCDAVHAAHLCGVIHRDLKPSNVRVDASDEPHVLDFGLAKSLGADETDAMTQTGQFLGTLTWASPEQLAGASSKVDLRSDVYALGAMLYQVLAGRPPFEPRGESSSAAERSRRDEAPRPSAALAAAGGSRLDDELDVIAMKCLAPDPDRRYQSAGDLARDVRRYLSGEPIEARRDSALYVLRKTMQRYRMRFALAGALLVSLVSFGVVMALLYGRASRLEQEASRAATALAELLSQSTLEQGRMAGLSGDAPQAESLLWREMLTQASPSGPAPRRLRPPPGLDEARWALIEHFERHASVLWRPFNDNDACVVAVAPDGRRALEVAIHAGAMREIDEFGGDRTAGTLALPLPLAGPFAGDDISWVAGFVGAEFQVWRIDEPESAYFTLPAPVRHRDAIAVRKDGARCAAAETDRIRVWETRTCESIAEIPVDVPVVAVAIAASSPWLATRDALGALSVWNYETSEPLAHLGHGPELRTGPHLSGPMQFSLDDRRLADGWAELPVRVWNWMSDAEDVVTLPGFPSTYRAMCLSPDGARLALGDPTGSLRVYDVATAAILLDFTAHSGRVYGVGFNAAGDRVWSSGPDAIRVWDVSRRGVRERRCAGETLHCVTFNRDESLIFAAGGEGRVYRFARWDADRPAWPSRMRTTISGLALDPSGELLAVGAHRDGVTVMDTRDGSERLRLPHPAEVSSLVFSPDGASVLTACDDGGVRRWNARTGEIEWERQISAARLPSIAFSPSGERLAVVTREGALWVCSADGETCEPWLPASGTPLRAVRYSADGRWLLAAGAGRQVVIWDLAHPGEPRVLVGQNQEIYALDISASGLIASGDTVGRIRISDAERGTALATLDGHAGGVMALQFSRDSRTLLSVGMDGRVCEWDLAYPLPYMARQLEARLRSLKIDPRDEPLAQAWRDWARDLLEREGAAQRGAPVANP